MKRRLKSASACGMQATGRLSSLPPQVRNWTRDWIDQPQKFFEEVFRVRLETSGQAPIDQPTRGSRWRSDLPLRSAT
jgi:hypothetical protein